jgi:hypothetical protein
LLSAVFRDFRARHFSSIGQGIRRQFDPSVYGKYLAFGRDIKASTTDISVGDELSVEAVVSNAKQFVVQIVCTPTVAEATAPPADRNADAFVPAGGPSFDCSRATKPDERAICSNETLARLDRATTDAFYQARAHNKRAAIAAARAFLSSRGACNGDIACIQKAQYDAVRAFADLGASVNPADLR